MSDQRNDANLSVESNWPSGDATAGDSPADGDLLPAVAEFSWWQQRTLVLKELRETLRDRRTLITLLAMPLLLYPLLGLGFRFLAFQKLSTEQPQYIVACNSEKEASWLLEEVKRGLNAQGDGQPKTGTGARLQSPAIPELHVSVLQDGSQHNLEELVSNGVVDIGIQVSRSAVQNPISSTDDAVSVLLIENPGLINSQRAAEFVERQLSANNIDRIRSWAANHQVDFQIPIVQQRFRVTSRDTGSALTSLLPLILLLMTVTGGVYPAIDLTAGERERNTLETLMSLPIPKFRLLMAKYVAVVVVTLLTGAMNLLAMSLTLYALQLDVALLGTGGFTPSLALKLLLMLGVFALFYSAMLLTLTSSARSFKEAQAYLIPLLLLSIAPGLVILLPGWELNRATAGLPLINVLLLARALMEGTAGVLPSAVALGSTFLYSIAALSLASRKFADDAVAVGSQGGWRDMLRPRPLGQLWPSAATAWVGLAILFPAYFVVSGLISRGEDVPAETRLLLAAAMTVLLFLGLPLACLRWEGISGRQGLSLRRTKLSALAAALLFGLSTWPWIFEMIVVAQGLGLHGVDLSQYEVVRELLAKWQAVPLALVVLTMGVAPGLCEECFFRGFLYNGLRQQLNVWQTIVVTAILFGLFHVVLAGIAAPERLVPSTLMGLLLGWIRWRTGSLIPCVLLHVVHNSVLLMMARYNDHLAGWGLEGVMHQSHLPPTWLGIAAVVFILGAMAIKAVGKPVEFSEPKALG